MSIHKSKQWIEKREKFMEGKVCEWCGSTDQLSIHHKNPPKVGIGPYNKIANEYYQEYFKDDNNESELKQYFEEIYARAHYKVQNWEVNQISINSENIEIVLFGIPYIAGTTHSLIT